MSCDRPAIAFKWQNISAEFKNYCKGKVCKLNINQKSLTTYGGFQDVYKDTADRYSFMNYWKLSIRHL